MKLPLHVAASVFVLATSGSAIAQTSAVSIYTNIVGRDCAKHIDDRRTGAYTMDCPGVNGFRLHVMEDDERSSVSVVTPDKRIFPLNYWEVVARGFSSLGAKAEWRIVKVDGKAKPIALIVRVNSIDQSDPDHPKRLSFLAVAKISGEAACVTQTVDALLPDANAQARRIADDEHTDCLSAESAIKPSAKG